MSAHRILITGGSGFLGQSVQKILKHDFPESEIYTPRSRHFNLTDKYACEKSFYYYNSIDTVIHLAATCGGIQANEKNPAKYFYDNMMMGINVIEACHTFNVNKLILVGTVCSYPKYCPVPFKEEDIWNGYPEETNAPYGVAKKSLYIMADAYSRQYGLNTTILIPSNLYGPNDHFDESKSHVIPALIKKIDQAKKNNTRLEIWGDGSATRDFLYVDDAAKAISLSIAADTDTKPMNLGNTKEISIKTLAETLCDLMEYNGEIYWNTSKPNGQPRRCVDFSLARQILGWEPLTDLHQGLKQTIEYYETTK